jgi:excisionase family DNA binding protein
MEALLERTTKQEQRIAQSFISEIQKTHPRIKTHDRAVDIKINGSGEFLKIPKKALLLLYEILKNMAEGKSITLIPSDAEISTQQAADMLNVSRPHLVKLLESGEIPFKKVGAHRRIALKDLITYEKRLKENRKEKLTFLAKQAQELNLGY